MTHSHYNNGEVSSFVGLRDTTGETEVDDYDFIEQATIEGNYLFTGNCEKEGF